MSIGEHLSEETGKVRALVHKLISLTLSFTKRHLLLEERTIATTAGRCSRFPAGMNTVSRQRRVSSGKHRYLPTTATGGQCGLLSRAIGDARRLSQPGVARFSELPGRWARRAPAVMRVFTGTGGCAVCTLLARGAAYLLP